MNTSQVLAQLQKVKYGGLDFATAADDLKANLQVKFAAEYNDFAASALGIVLLDTVAYGIDTLGFYLDRRATDTFLSTARTRRAVARLTRQLGYKMRAAVASSVDLTVSLKQAQVFNVPIPQGFQFKGPDDLVFEVFETVTIPAGSTSEYRVACYQGQTITENYVSDGTSNQVFELSHVSEGAFVTNGTAVVTVNGVPWDEKEMLEFTATNEYEIGYNDDPPTLRFGDGTVGNIPLTGASIVIRYVISRGKSGITSRNTIKDVVSPLVVSFTTVDMNITNADGSIGGDDAETLDSARTFAPKVWKSRYVAVTKEDYEALSGSYADPLFGRVAVAQALSSRSAATDLALTNYLNGIRALVFAPVSQVQADVAALEASFASLSSDLTDLNTSLTGIATKMNSIGDATSGSAASAIQGVQQNKNDAVDIQVDLDNIDVAWQAGKVQVDAYGPTGTAQLNAGEVASINQYFDTIDGSSGAARVLASGIVTNYAATVGYIRQIVTYGDDIGRDLTTSPSLLYDADQLRQSMETAVGDSTTPAGMYVQTADILAVVVDVSVAVDAILGDIYDHVDALLAADCKANLVTVPILSRDAAGFYASPSTGLVKSLQSFLEERNEVTHSVSVVPGDDFLVPAVIDIEIGVLPDFSQTATEIAVKTVAENMLRDRSFGQSLYRSILIQACLAVEGVGWVNATISGSYVVPLTTPPVLTTTYLDASGNLILGDGKVLTRGLVSTSSTQLTNLEALKVVPKTS